MEDLFRKRENIIMGYSSGMYVNDSDKMKLKAAIDINVAFPSKYARESFEEYGCVWEGYGSTRQLVQCIRDAIGIRNSNESTSSDYSCDSFEVCIAQLIGFESAFSELSEIPEIKAILALLDMNDENGAYDVMYNWIHGITTVKSISASVPMPACINIGNMTAKLNRNEEYIHTPTYSERIENRKDSHDENILPRELSFDIMPTWKTNEITASIRNADIPLDFSIAEKNTTLRVNAIITLTQALKSIDSRLRSDIERIIIESPETLYVLSSLGKISQVLNKAGIKTVEFDGDW